MTPPRRGRKAKKKLREFTGWIDPEHFKRRYGWSQICRSRRFRSIYTKNMAVRVLVREVARKGRHKP